MTYFEPLQIAQSIAKTVAIFGKLTTSRYGNISISCVLCEKLMPNSKQIARSESAASDNRQEVKDTGCLLPGA